MKLTKEEKAICRQYSARQADGFVRCRECPLAVDIQGMVCKATCHQTEDGEWVPDGWEEEYEQDL